MYFELVCLMASGKPLTERTSRLLFHTAREMFRRKRRAYAFRTDDAEGEMRTKFESSNLGSFSGIVFAAEVGTNAGTTRVKFIVEDAILEDEREVRDEDLEFFPLTRRRAQAAPWN